MNHPYTRGNRDALLNFAAWLDQQAKVYADEACKIVARSPATRQRELLCHGLDRAWQTCLYAAAQARQDAEKLPMDPEEPCPVPT